MRNLGDTISRLTPKPARGPQSGTRLASFEIHGPNPGALKAGKHVPSQLSAHPALVVVLHGCTQTPDAYDMGSGWSTMADRHGFIVLYPQQQRANNPGLCFNWYSPEDARRDGGEAASIRSAIETAILQHDIDRTRVFVTGLSAGGAMTSVMLATYPEVFAGGAIIAGLPYASATSLPEAFDRMRGHDLPSASAAAAAVLTASGHAGPWPSLSVWQGSADHTVAPSNADALLAQWAGVHDLELSLAETTEISGHACRVWRDAAGRPVLEDYRVRGMGHGVPIDARGEGAVGAAGAYMLDCGLSSTERIAAQWGLAPTGASGATAAGPRRAPAPVRMQASQPLPAPPVETSSVQRVIEDALRRAGLM